VHLQASFYISYILTNATVAKGLAFLRIPGAVIFLFLSRLSGTKRQKKKTWSQQFVQYGTELPDHTITALLLLVFSVAQPFVALISVLYFIFVFFYTRYQLLYTQRERFQTGGLFWPVVRPSSHYIRITVPLLGMPNMLCRFVLFCLHHVRFVCVSGGTCSDSQRCSGMTIQVNKCTKNV
jgi:Calcium-dependent channel, 7TM region, putative phosphate